jgi:hypothetical protein
MMHGIVGSDITNKRCEKRKAMHSQHSQHALYSYGAFTIHLQCILNLLGDPLIPAFTEEKSSGMMKTSLMPMRLAVFYPAENMMAILLVS